MAILNVTCSCGCKGFTLKTEYNRASFPLTKQVRVKKGEDGLYRLEVLTCGNYGRWRFVYWVADKRVRSVRSKIDRFIARGDTTGRTLEFTKEDLGDAVTEAMLKRRQSPETERPRPRVIRIEVGRRIEKLKTWDYLSPVRD